MFKAIAVLTAMFSLFMTSVLPVAAKVGDVRTFFSKTYGGDGGDANSAFLDTPQGFLADSSCNLYIADTGNYVIRKIDTSNIITTYAGSNKYDKNNGALRTASFRSPTDIVMSSTGEFYVSDADTNSIRLISGSVVSTWLSNLKQPQGVATDGTSLFVSDTGHNKILKVNLTTKSASTLATLTSPGKMVILNGTIYVVHAGYTALAAVDMTTGNVTDLKTGMQDTEGVTTYNSQIYFISGTNGTWNSLWQYNPSGGAITLLQNVPETEWYNHASDLLFCGGKMYILFKAGSSIFTADLDGSNPVKIAGLHRWNDRNGALSQALTGRPTAMALSPDGKKVYLIENEKIKVINLKAKTLSFLAGHADDNYVDGVGGAARFSGVQQIVMSPGGTKIYLADRNNNRIRVFDLKTLTLSTLTGAGGFNLFNGTANAYAEGGPCTTTTLGVAGCAYFDRPTGIAISKNGKTLYVADSFNHRIRTVDVATGKTKLLAGSGISGMKDGVGSAARFKRPSNLLLDKNGLTLYVVDSSAHAISAINLHTKKVTRLMGTGKAGYLDGKWNQAVLSYPDTLSYGPAHTLLLTEVGSQRVRTIDLTKKTISLAAGSGQRGNANGDKSHATFNQPRGVLLISPHTALVADQLNDLIRTINL